MISTSRARTTTATNTEAEMSRSQQDLVSSCWEENQYDQGITILEQLRSPKHRPSAQHIRQLVYLALHSSTPVVPQTTDVQASPTKLKRERFQISPKTVTNARHLLLSFALTNTPAGLLGAIPSCENDLSEWDNYEESVLSKESLRVIRAKTCWDLLKPDFAKVVAISTPRAGRQRRRTRHNSDEEEDEDAMELVSDDAWPLLEWFVVLFERDETNTQQGEPSYSRLLLAQIPPNRDGKDARWDFNRPLDVAFAALQQDSSEQHRLGSRLLTLLINLAFTIYLDFPMLVTAMFNRLSTSPRSVVLELLSLLPPSLPVLRFKLSLCQRLLAADLPSTQRRAAPRPRALPKARNSTASEPPTQTQTASQPTARKITGPALKDLLDIACSTGTTHATLPLLRIRFELLLSYVLIQNQLPEEEQDIEWKAAVGNGEFGKAVGVTFTGNDADGPIYSQILQSLVIVK